MDKLVVIDGNSLLNRAFYAMAVFSTKDGLPTNGIFGFIKLLLKIIDDEKPKYIAVAFDVHAPTFRHGIYKEYKGTRKPMPEELVKQVPVLKELLRSMGIQIIEKAGYEADDIIGTLSRAYEDVHTVIFTGDRDAFQLVNENVTVCFTKRGVSDLDRMTGENFFEKTGLTPSQIIEEKALMGDSSDNIPGIKGIGAKTAVTLLSKYGDIDTIYLHTDELKGALKDKIINGKESAYLSRTLATIDLNAPIEVSLQDCTYQIPFSEEAREFFARLEFRSLVNSEYFSTKREVKIQTVVCSSLNDFNNVYEQADLLSFCIENEPHIYTGGKEYIFPLRDSLLSPGFFQEELAPVFRRLFNGNKTVIVVDYKQLAHKMAEYGIQITCPIEDISLLRYISDSNQRPSNAIEIAKDYVLTEENCAYALLLAYEESIERMKGTDEETLYRNLELPLARVLFDMEQTGVRVAQEKFGEFSEKFNTELQTLSEEIFRLAGETFNLKSPFQLSHILFEKLGYPTHGAKKNIRGGYSTEADILEKLAEEYEIAQLILRYREIQKLLSTYIDGVQPLVTNGLIHTTYHQTITATGRLSSANPNLQNIPVRKEEGKELRKLFIARDGNVLIDADYSQIELRLLAHFSQCQPLIEAYNQERDIHALTASQVFGVPLPEVTGEMRRRAKAVNFGIIYGISAFGLAKDLGCTNAEAAAYIDRYFSTYSDVKEYMEENVRRAREEGFITTILGRKRYIPELKSSNYNQRQFGERAAMNMPLQGSSADIIKVAMVNVSKRLIKEGLQTKMIMQVHDELVLDAPLSEVEIASQILKEEMENAVKLRVPLTVDVSQGVSWYEAKK